MNGSPKKFWFSDDGDEGQAKMLRVVYRDQLFVCQCSFQERGIPKAAGFHWTKPRPFWHTENPGVADRLRAHFEPSAKKQLARTKIEYAPWSGPLPFPPSLAPYPFQKDPGATFALSRNKSYLGLAPGLGKTIVAALIRNALKVPTVIISPPFLARNAFAEFSKWGTAQPLIERYDSREPLGYLVPDVLIVPDNQLGNPDARREIGDVVNHASRLGVEPCLIVDEAHRFKSFEAERTRILFGGENGAPGIIDSFPRQVYLSGTPMPNRPMELFPILSKVAPETIDYMTKEEYGQKFCGARFDGYAWDYSGSSNLAELRERVIGPFMLRMRKGDAGIKLPPKTEEIVLIGELPPRMIALEAKILAKHSPEDLVAGRVSSDHVSTYRKELGLIKVKPAVDFLRSLLDESDSPLVIFAYHTEVIAKLAESLKRYQPLVITGSTPNKRRDEIVREFQTNPKRKLFLGNYLASGVGLTLTKASDVIFVEWSWVDAENEQGVDRTHRIGQTRDVHSRFLVYDNSMDRKLIETNLRKRTITSYL